MKPNNPRDERGWRIPRKGCKSYQIYELMVAGFKSGEIAELFGESQNRIGVLMYNIRNPDAHNWRSNKYYKNNATLLNELMANKRAKAIKPPKVPVQKKKYSPYVRKLVKILGVSYREAVAEEQKMIEQGKL